MKHLALLFQIFFCMFHADLIKAAECDPNPFGSQDIQLKTQAEVDNFQASHGNGGVCDTTPGALGIGWSGSDITDLSPLSALIQINGDLRISLLEELDSLNGLNNVASIGGSLFIHDNATLQDIDDLANLQTLAGGEIYIAYNSLLQRINGLSALSSDVWAFVLVSNPKIASIENFQFSWEAPSRFQITNIDELTRFDIPPGLQEADYLIINGNAKLESIGGLSEVRIVHDDMSILGNDRLKDLNGLSNIEAVFKDVTIKDNSALSNCSGVVKLLDSIDQGDPGPGPGPSGIPDIGGTLVFGNNGKYCKTVEDALKFIFVNGFEEGGL